MLINKNTSRPNQYVFLTLAALLILAVSVALWYFPKEYAYRLQHPQNLKPVDGVWDLTGFDLDKEIVFLEGSVEYVPGVLLTPEEFDTYTNTIYYGKVPSDTKVATARLRLFFPEDKVYSLASGSVAYNERVYVNGQWRHDVGTPGLTEEESVAGSNFNRFDVMPVNGLVEILRQSSNFVHKENSGFAGYWVGSAANIKQMVSVNQMFTAINIGLYLCLFVLHLILYLVIRSYRPNLWFALLCLAWLLRAGFTGRFVYWSMFPDIPWELTYKLGCISIALTGMLLMLMARDQFSGVVQRWPLRVSLALQSVSVIFYLIADTVLCSEVKIVSEVLAALSAVYLAVRFVIVLPEQIRQRRLLTEQVITLIGICVALFTMLHDAIRYNNIMPGLFHYEIGDVGMLILVLFQMAAMVFATMRQLTLAHQNAQIAWENAELARKSEKLALLRAEGAEQDLELHRRLVADIPVESLVTCGPITLNLAAGQAYLKDMDILLTPKDFALLYILIKNAELTINREALHEQAWKQPLSPKDRALDSSIYRLRKKLAGSGYEIITVRGEGFCLKKSEKY